MSGANVLGGYALGDYAGPTTQPAPVPVPLTYYFGVDWTDTGVYVDGTARVLALPVARRGRDRASQLDGRAGPSTLSAILDNSDGRFSSYNSSSPLFGHLLPGHKMKFVLNGMPRWAGFLKEINPNSAGAGSGPTATLSGWGALAALAGVQQLDAPGDPGSATGVILGKVLDAAGWPSLDRVIDTGVSTTSRWFIDGTKDALEECRRIEDTELGFLYDDELGRVVFEDRHHRLSGAHLTPQATYSDVVGGISYNAEVAQIDPLPSIYNRATAVVQSYVTSALAVLWTLGEAPILAPGQSKTWVAEYPNSGTLGSLRAVCVAAWTTPDNTDITVTGVAFSDLTITVVKTATKMKITARNNHGSLSGTLTLMRGRGTPVLKSGDPTTLQSDDVASQAIFRIRGYPLAAPFLANLADGQDFADHVVGQYAWPLPVARIGFDMLQAGAAPASAIARRISDRITLVATGPLTRFGLSRDFFIESIEDVIGFDPPRHDVWFELSPAGDGVFWIVGTSVLGTNTFLGY